VLSKVRLNLGLLGKNLTILQSIVRIEGITHLAQKSLQGDISLHGDIHRDISLHGDIQAMWMILGYSTDAPFCPWEVNR
jgi:hypothetical protein